MDHIPVWLKAVILGVVEGVTEFLPVSSTGHLLVVGQWLGFESEMFTVFIQLGALSAVWWLYRQRLLRMIPRKDSANLADQRLGWQVLAAFVPIFVLGYTTHSWIKTHLFSAGTIAWALVGGGIAILLVEGFKPRVAVEKLEGLTLRLALIVGLGQCLALWPGISRSGATIMVALVAGLGRPAATEFSFLLAVPTMTAAAVYELVKHRQELSASMVGLLAIGFAVSFLVALAIVKWFVRFVQTHTFEGFAWYRIVAGAILLAMASKGMFQHGPQP